MVGSGTLQRVVDHSRGESSSSSAASRGTFIRACMASIDLVGKADIRQFVRLMHHASGGHLPGHVRHASGGGRRSQTRPAKNRACVVMPGGREPSQWEKYGHHRFLETNGALPCCDNGGLLEGSVPVRLAMAMRPIGLESLCLKPIVFAPDLVIPRCMDLITTAD